MTYEETRWKGK